MGAIDNDELVVHDRIQSIEAGVDGIVARMPVNLLERRNYRDELI